MTDLNAADASSAPQDNNVNDAAPQQPDAAVAQPSAPQPSVSQPEAAAQQAAAFQPEATPQPEAAPQQVSAPQQPGTPYTQQPTAQQTYPQQTYAPQGYYYPDPTAVPPTGASYTAGGPGWSAGPGMPGYPNYPYGAYPPSPQQAQQTQPKKRRVWLWMILALVVVFVLGVGGCVSCMAASMLASLDSYESSSYYDYSYEDDDYDYYDDFYDYLYNYYVYTLDEIIALADGLTNQVENGVASAGLYWVGTGFDLEPGEYFLEGDATEEGSYYCFRYNESEDYYVLTESIVYFGNYYAHFEEGDIVVFIPASDDHCMMLSENASFSPTAPYRSGLYLVGVDIPAGTYTATCDTEAADNASGDAAVYIMQDLDWDDDSITDTYYVLTGGSHTITLEEGMWVEAYAAILTPASSEAYDQEQEALN